MTRSPFARERASKKSIPRAPWVAIAVGLACVLGVSAAPIRAGGPPDCIPGTLVNDAATGAIAQFDVPANATELRVEMTGGSGGNSLTDFSELSPDGQVNFLGGRGVHVISVFEVAGPFTLNVLAGSEGGESGDPGFGAGGGGGSFLFTPAGELYLAAAGGGGATSGFRGREEDGRPGDSPRCCAPAPCG